MMKRLDQCDGLKSNSRGCTQSNIRVIVLTARRPLDTRCGQNIQEGSWDAYDGTWKRPAARQGFGKVFPR
jgi:hypothetical protein